jgi:hypothetical protein
MRDAIAGAVAARMAAKRDQLALGVAAIGVAAFAGLELDQ